MKTLVNGQSGSTLQVVMLITTITAMGAISIMKLVSASRMAANAQNCKIRANNMAEAGAFRALSILKRDAADPLLNMGEMDASAFTTYSTGIFAVAVNGNTGVRYADLLGFQDGSYDLETLTRDSDDLFTIRANGHYRDGPSATVYDPSSTLGE